MEKQTMSFQAETKQLLDLMIHSIYTHKEIFLRELISNASDAIDKVKFEALKDPAILGDDTDYKVFITVDKNGRTITISDNGIGMNSDEVVKNIGTIAKSGSKAFMEKLKEKNEDSSDLDIIGQFGVGFYSSFMMADRVTLLTKSALSDQAVKWESNGDGTYTIENADKTSRGTVITLHLRDEKDGDYNDYLDQDKISSLIKKYSDYIRYPIKMDTEEKTEDNETVITEKTLNSMVPLWKKSKSDITQEEYNEFYKASFHDWQDPSELVHIKAEGTIEYTSLLFIPSKAPFDFYSKEFKKGVQLYSKNVFIMENCEELIPDYFRFVKGLVDSPDFSLNISREILQHNRQLKVISKNIEKKIISTLKDMLKSDREKYSTFWKEFGEAIKSGIYGDASNKDKLEDLLLFNSSNSDKMITLDEYVSNMKEEQDVIYFATGHERSFVENLPQMELLKDKGYEVLFLLDRIDEFVTDRMMDYKGNKFKSITRGELDLGKESEDEIKVKEELENDNKDLLTAMKDILKDKVSNVKLTNRLKSTAVCLVSDDSGISFGMEKIMKDMPQMDGMPGMKASRIMELNPEHEVFTSLNSAFAKGSESEELQDLSEILYGQALLMENITLDNPMEFAKKISKLITRIK